MLNENRQMEIKNRNQTSNLRLKAANMSLLNKYKSKKIRNHLVYDKLHFFTVCQSWIFQLQKIKAAQLCLVSYILCGREKF